MATLFNSTLLPACSPASIIQGWAQFTENVLLGGGWIYVPQTGDTAPNTLPAATSGSQKRGFRVYQMNDALQATAPVFIRIDWGSFLNTFPFGPAIWMVIGKGVDGAGNITNQVLLPTGPNPLMGPQSVSSTGTHNCYGSAGTNRFTMGLFTNLGNSYGITFGLERTKDAIGNDTDAGLLLVHSSLVTSDVMLRYSYYLSYTSPVQPSREDNLNYVLASPNPSETYTPGDIGLGVIIPIFGVAKQPGMNFLLCNSLDVSTHGFINTIIYGQTHTYQQIGVMHTAKSLVGNSSLNATDTNVRILIRYE